MADQAKGKGIAPKRASNPADPGQSSRPPLPIRTLLEDKEDSEDYSEVIEVLKQHIKSYKRDSVSAIKNISSTLASLSNSSNAAAATTGKTSYSPRFDPFSSTMDLDSPLRPPRKEPHLGPAIDNTATSNLDPPMNTGSKEGFKDTITSSIYNRPIESKKEDVYNEFYALTFSTYRKGLSAFNAEFNGYLAKLTMAKIDIDPSLILNQYFKALESKFPSWLQRGRRTGPIVTCPSPDRTNPSDPNPADPNPAAPSPLEAVNKAPKRSGYSFLTYLTTAAATTTTTTTSAANPTTAITAIRSTDISFDSPFKGLSSNHISNSKEQFTTFTPNTGQLRPINTRNSPISPASIGSITLEVLSRKAPPTYTKLVLDNVLYLPNIDINIISRVRHYDLGGCIIKETLYGGNRRCIAILDFKKSGFFLDVKGSSKPILHANFAFPLGLTSYNTTKSIEPQRNKIVVEIPSNSIRKEDYRPIIEDAIVSKAIEPNKRYKLRNSPAKDTTLEGIGPSLRGKRPYRPTREPKPLTGTGDLPYMLREPVIEGNKVEKAISSPTLKEPNIGQRDYYNLLNLAKLWHVRLGHIGLRLLKKTSSITKGLSNFDKIKEADFHCSSCDRGKAVRRVSKALIPNLPRVLDSIEGDTVKIRPRPYNRNPVVLLLVNRKKAIVELVNSTAITNKETTPFQALFDKLEPGILQIPNLERYRAIGAREKAIIPLEKRSKSLKFTSRAEGCNLLAVLGSKTYLVYIPSRRAVLKTSTVKFIEDNTVLSQPTDNTALEGELVDLDLDLEGAVSPDPSNLNTEKPISIEIGSSKLEPYESSSDSELDEPSPDKPINPVIVESTRPTISIRKPELPEAVPQTMEPFFAPKPIEVIAPNQPITNEPDKMQLDYYKLLAKTSSYILSFVYKARKRVISKDSTPTTFKQVLKLPRDERSKWLEAITKEFIQLLELGVFKFLPRSLLPSNRKLITCRNVLKVKKGAKNRPIKYKSRSLNRPTKSHLNAAKNLFKYLNSTKDYSICFSYNGNTVANLGPKLSNSSNTTTKLSRDFHSKEGPRPLTTTSTTIVDSRNSKGSSRTSIINSSLVPIGFSDSDFAGDKATSKSTYGYLYKLAGRPISWKTKRATTIALSTLEAETNRLTEAIREVQWIIGLLSELHRPIDYPITLYRDNQGSITVANDPALYARTKHTLLKFRYIREQVKAKIVTIIYLNTKYIPADRLTKALPGKPHDFSSDLGQSSRPLLPIRTLSEDEEDSEDYSEVIEVLKQHIKSYKRVIASQSSDIKTLLLSLNTLKASIKDSVSAIKNISSTLASLTNSSHATATTIGKPSYSPRFDPFSSTIDLDSPLRPPRKEPHLGPAVNSATSNLDPPIDTGSKEGFKDTITSSIVKELSKKAYTIPDNRISNLLENPNIPNTYSDSNQAILLMLLYNSLSSSPRAAISWIHIPSKAFKLLVRQYSRPIESKKEDVYNEFHALTFSTYRKGLSAFNAEFNGYLAKLTMARIDIDPSLILNQNLAIEAYRAAYVANSSNSTPNSNFNPSKKGKNKKKGKKKASYNIKGQNYSAKSAEQASFMLGSYNLAIEEEKEESDSSSNSSQLRPINTGNGPVIPAGIGSITLEVLSREAPPTYTKLVLDNVLYLPNIDINIRNKIVVEIPFNSIRKEDYRSIIEDAIVSEAIEPNKRYKLRNSPAKGTTLEGIGPSLRGKRPYRPGAVSLDPSNLNTKKPISIEIGPSKLEPYESSSDSKLDKPLPDRPINPVIVESTRPTISIRKPEIPEAFPKTIEPIFASKPIKVIAPNQPITEEIYIEIPKGLLDLVASNKAIYKLLLKYGYNPSTPNIIKLSKALYSLKQSPREWPDKLKILLKSLGYLPLILDPGVFYNAKTCPFIVTYIDDCLFIGPYIGYITDLKQQLKKYLNSTKDYSICFSYNGNIVADLGPKLSNSSNTTTKLSRDFHSKEGPRPLTTTSTTIVDSRNGKGSSRTSIINSSLVPIGFSDSDFTGDKATSKSTYCYLYKLAEAIREVQTKYTLLKFRYVREQGKAKIVTIIYLNTKFNSTGYFTAL
ncbi:hypothetical protein P8C59_007606 [Phyllachora maydis]|uniref:Uncharacterized protein n=1 Tax=Phyllachora maydis TaxID=1825666 RepID=A0AAD9IAN5_9PEZI|nr:hypothetical protein P8C59_007606 [Phyllachora maydis]